MTFSRIFRKDPLSKITKLPTLFLPATSSSLTQPQMNHTKLFQKKEKVALPTSIILAT